MTRTLRRRSFIRRSIAAGISVAAAPALLSGEPSRRIAVGVMGLGRGMGHVEALLECPDVEIAYVCDVDSRRLESGLAALRGKTEGKQARRPEGVKDFRRILDDMGVDALSIAAPNFWHATATILACAAGKHVYVEKPGSHDAREGELVVEAARKHGRVVQMGNQRRSQPGIIEGFEKLRGGAIGTVRFARTWYSSSRPSIGRGKETPVPEWLDYDLWEGPVPHRPYRDNLVHYNWHWMWHWGGGEVANNGVHVLDLARWGLGVDYPRTVTMSGGRYRFDDDQETPDTLVAGFEFGACEASLDSTSCHPRKVEDPPLAAFYGDGGSMRVEGAGYRIFDLDGKVVASQAGTWKDSFHFQNWLDGIREGRKLNADIEDGQKSTLLCHLANIAYRTGRTLRCDPATGKVVGEEDAVRRLWGREYRPGWEPKV